MVFDKKSMPIVACVKYIKHFMFTSVEVTFTSENRLKLHFRANFTKYSTTPIHYREKNIYYIK